MKKNKNNFSSRNAAENELQKLIDENKYNEAVSLLYKQQAESWPLLKEGLLSLESVQIKKVFFDGYEIHVQHNPRRINSTTAIVSKERLKNIKCLLCLENLPEGEVAINYKDEYNILCNPYPIFHEHLTISRKEHIPQRIINSFKYLLQISKDFSDFALIYNGPEAGASVPVHQHFQACKKYSLPVENDYEGLKNEYGEEIQNKVASVFAVNDGLRKFISIESDSSQHIENIFKKIYEIYSHISVNHLEPMMNVLCSYDKETGWRVIIFFRGKHRPEAYFKEGEANILVSPATIDIGGVLITPLEKDFKNLNKEKISQIFREVIIGKEEFEYLKSSLKE